MVVRPPRTRHEWSFLRFRDAAIGTERGEACLLAPMRIESERPGWYALRTKAHHERVASEYLKNRGLEVFLPYYKSRRIWTDRIKVVDQPLFDGYFFCRLGTKEELIARGAPGVLYIVSQGGKPALVPQNEIDGVRIVMEQGLTASPVAYLKEGLRVRLRDSAFEGLEGRLEKIKSRCRLVLSVHLLQRSVAFEVSPEMIEVVN